MGARRSDRILVVDDDEDRLAQLLAATRASIHASGVSIDVEGWRPSNGEEPFDTFEAKTKDHPVLVASDMELTGSGLTGLFGSSIVAWCQQRAIPVCGYTQRPGRLLSKDPDLFEFRIAIDPATAGKQMAGIATGFVDIRKAIPALVGDAPALRSPTELIAKLLGRPTQAAPFSLYASRIASSNAAIVDIVRRESASETLREELSTYICGHLLLNGILRFPGPIVSLEALCAYLALPAEAGRSVASVFVAASYDGPFKSLDEFYWIDDIDERIDDLAADQGLNPSDPADEYRRAVVERHLNTELGRHGCDRCQGRRGGFWCPFERRPVCDRADCSIASSNLVPQGAGLTRVERDFYDQWIPLLGL